MSKIMYKKPSAEVVKFENEDILTWCYCKGMGPGHSGDPEPTPTPTPDCGYIHKISEWI